MIKQRLGKLERKAGEVEPELSPYLKKLIAEMEEDHRINGKRHCECETYLYGLACCVYGACISITPIEEQRKAFK